MKKTFLLVLVLSAFLLSGKIYSQGYFVEGAGKYINEDKFKTNIQEDLTKYEGTYRAISESYESCYIFNVSICGEVLDIVFIYGGSDDGGENWGWDTTVYKGITVINGKFALNDIQENFGNANFRFVKVTYQRERDNKAIKNEGFVMEDYMTFAEKGK
ncbi:MAG TPA: hypothetical protein VIK14_02840 [Ignavibacteria bacterium]